jgi:hypothetical protein
MVVRFVQHPARVSDGVSDCSNHFLEESRHVEK